MIPSEYDIGDLMKMTDDDWQRGYEVRPGLSVSMPAEDDEYNRVWVAAGRGSTNMRRNRGPDTCWWVSVARLDDEAGGWDEEEVRITDDDGDGVYDEPGNLVKWIDLEQIDSQFSNF